MKNFVFALLVAATPGVACAQSVTYEVQGFPMSLHQAQVTGLANVSEFRETPAPEYQGLPVSPVQSLVLSPHARPLGTVAHADDADRGRAELLVPASSQQ